MITMGNSRFKPQISIRSLGYGQGHWPFHVVIHPKLDAMLEMDRARTRAYGKNFWASSYASAMAK